MPTLLKLTSINQSVILFYIPEDSFVKFVVGFHCLVVRAIKVLFNTRIIPSSRRCFLIIGVICPET
jgi:hypothetical protein